MYFIKYGKQEFKKIITYSKMNGEEGLDDMYDVIITCG